PAPPLDKPDEYRRTLAEERDGVHDGLWRISRNLGNEPLLILVDQFEELYALRPADAGETDAAERLAFVETLLHAARHPTSGVSIVITLRTDFVGHTQAHSGLNQAIAAETRLVPAMSPTELRDAIAKPAIKAG